MGAKSHCFARCLPARRYTLAGGRPAVFQAGLQACLPCAALRHPVQRDFIFWQAALG